MMDLSTIKELSIGGVKLRELSVDGTKVWRAGRLPAGYTELESLTATGTQCIDSGITGVNGLSVELTFTPIALLSADSSTIIGCTNSSNQRMYVTVNKTPAPKFYWELGAGGYHVLVGETHRYSVNQKYHIKVNWTKSKSVLNVDGNDLITMTNTLAFDNNNTNMYFFARNKGTSVDKYSYSTLWGDQFMAINGVLVGQFVPARYHDGTLGLYNLVTNEFRTNAGTGEFIAGGVVG